MTYNTKRRRSFSAKQRTAFLETHGAVCYWCKEPILPGQPWDIEHMMARELLHADDDPDGNWNLAPIHHLPCHKSKTAADRKVIAKSNHVRKKHGLDPVTKKPGVKIKSKGFQSGHRPLQSKSTFQQRRAPWLPAKKSPPSK